MPPNSANLPLANEPLRVYRPFTLSRKASRFPNPLTKGAALTVKISRSRLTTLIAGAIAVRNCA